MQVVAAPVEKELERIVSELKAVERFKVDFEPKKTVTRVVVRINYDALKLPKQAFSPEAKQYLFNAHLVSDAIERKSIVFAKKIKNTRKNFEELIDELEELLNRSNEIISEFDEYLTEQQQKIKKFLKKYREENSRAYRKAREEAKCEREALANGDFENVSDKRIKEFLRDELGFKNIVVLDKSSKHRAVLVAKVYYINYDSWYVEELYLAGLDDNQESWSIQVADYQGMYMKLDGFKEESVEKAMATIFCIPTHFVKTAKRQGDVLIVDANGMGDKEILEKFGELKYTADLLGRIHPDETAEYRVKTEEAEEVSEFEILASHKLISDATMKVRRVEYRLIASEFLGYDEDGKAIVSRRRVGTQDIYIVDVKGRAELIHPSHQKVVLDKGRYVFVTYPSFFVAD